MSTFSSVLMQNSRIIGFHSISTEDLSRGLTESEVDSIKREAKSRKKTEITMIRKIPFAIFISFSYIILYGDVVWNLEYLIIIVGLKLFLLL